MKFKIGDQVTHKQYGNGKIIRIFDWYNSKYIVVQFDIENPNFYPHNCSFAQDDEELKLTK